MQLNEVKQLNIPKSPGVYQFLNKQGEIIYIGKAADLRSRVLSYWLKSAAHTPAKHSMLKQIVQIKWIDTESEIEALLLEANLVKKHQPLYNVVLRDDKRFLYIKVSTEDEIPGVFTTRKITKAGKYFGPFTSATAARETLKAIRKIWPYCNARERRKKPCFYYQINLCAGICAGMISRKEYIDKIIKPIILFFEGKKGRVITNYKLQITNYESRIKKGGLKKEERDEFLNKANKLKFDLFNIKKVLEHANIIGLTDKYAADAVELAKVLGLAKVPERIEGYDISNIFGREAVGSMVVFTGGEPEKQEYRKFKIRIGQGQADDVGMLKEVLERRFKRIKGVEFPADDSVAESWPAPDLIIIDGGKAQVNVAVRILKRYKLNIPVIGISKGGGLRSAIASDKLFFPGEKKPLELPLASPALHLLKRVRDEAHRFAINYHRKLRGKEFLKR
ncbi:excinuclease ABC subunit UvrC [Patescibacteria group bacterium]|nr:excinuclease ABC subunit UvrC [Patescibacteria group bacterium]